MPPSAGREPPDKRSGPATTPDRLKSTQPTSASIVDGYTLVVPS
jgi:hypothetical protein